MSVTFDFSKYNLCLVKFMRAVLVFLWDGAAALRAPGRVISTKSATIKPPSPVFAKVDSKKSAKFSKNFRIQRIFFVKYLSGPNCDYVSHNL